MFKFFKIKLYKKLFRTYILGLTVIFIAAYGIFFRTLIKRTVDNHMEEAKILYNRSEEDIYKKVADIENYIVFLYNNQKLMEDFQRFFGKSAEEYVSERIKDSYYDDDMKYFVEDLGTFISKENSGIKNIYFKSNKNIIRMDLDDIGTISFQYSITNHEYDEAINNIKNGYSYIRYLNRPENMSEFMGTIVFVFNNNDNFHLIKSQNYDYAAVYDENNTLYLSGGNNEKLVKDMKEVQLDPNSSGLWIGDTLNKTYYCQFTSNEHQYHIVIGLSFLTILNECLKMLILIAIGMIFLFFQMALIIAVSMNRDAAALNGIIHSINMAKSGKFEKVTISKQKDEYGIIASEINDMTDKLQLYIKKEYLFKIKQKEAQMQALMYQINPHFLYNTLEIIRSVVLQNRNEQAADALSSLGKMYRGLVKEEMVISIEKEITLLTNYLQIMELKYGDIFYYYIDVEESVKSLNTIKFWMQPLVENFFVHGFDKTKEYNVLLIQGEQLDDRYTIRIINNGKCGDYEELERINKELEENSGEFSNGHIGMRNVYHRLKYFYENKVTMRLINNDMSGLTVEINIMK